jgi:hypothetical protein
MSTKRRDLEHRLAQLHGQRILDGSYKASHVPEPLAAAAAAAETLERTGLGECFEGLAPKPRAPDKIIEAITASRRCSFTVSRRSPA